MRLEPGSRAAEALGATTVTVNSSHHQAIKDLAPDCVATGWTEDELIEAVEDGPGRTVASGGAVASGGDARASRKAPERGSSRLVKEASASVLVGG